MKIKKIVEFSSFLFLVGKKAKLEARLMFALSRSLKQLTVG